MDERHLQQLRAQVNDQAWQTIRILLDPTGTEAQEVAITPTIIGLRPKLPPPIKHRRKVVISMVTMLILQGSGQTQQTNLLCQLLCTTTQLNTNQVQLRMAISTSSEATVEKDFILNNPLIRNLALVFPIAMVACRIKGIVAIKWVNKRTFRLLSKMQGLLSETYLRQALVQGDKDQVVETATIKSRKYRVI